MTLPLPHTLENIILFEGVQNYTMIHYNDGNTHLSAYTLLRYEERAHDFIRVGRKYLVNKKFIAKINISDMTPHILMQNGNKIIIPRRKVKEFE